MDGDLKLFKPLLMEKPDIVVATPSKALLHVKAKNLDLKSELEMLVIDEADLVFSFGYEDEVKELLRYDHFTFIRYNENHLKLNYWD